MPVPENWLLSPLSIIDAMFDKSGVLDNATVSNFFTEKLANAQLYALIPSLNDVPLHNLTSGSLVRFRGMVQDMFDPEFFMGTYEVQRVKDGTSRLSTAMYRDVITCHPNEEINFDSPSNVTADRQTVYCVPIPGENAWAKEAYANICPKTTVQRECESKPSGCKRTLLEAEENEDRPSCSMETADDMSEAKRNKTVNDVSDSTLSSSAPVPAADLNFPLPNEKGPACLVKIYGSGFEDGKLNDVIEVIGILSVDPSMATFNDKSSSLNQADLNAGVELMDSAEEDAARNPPPSLVPRLHALVVKKLDQSNPFLSSAISRGCSISEGNVLENVIAVRDETLAILEQAVLGDRLAAEYLLCHLVSSVYSRRDVMALGKFALNLSGCPRDRSTTFVGHLDSLVSSLVTKSNLLSLSLENLNGSRFVPHKDYAANRLRTGRLQLSAGTHLIVDETSMEPGQLQAQGVMNLTALGNIVTWQRIDYDFEYHTQSFFTDLVVLVLSEGKSMLKCDCLVPIVYDVAALANVEEKFKGIHTYLTPELLQRIRKYLSYVQLLNYNVPDDVQKVIEQDFVEKRRNNADNLSVPDFHMLLTLARLLSLCSGETNLTETTWRQALSMESMRADRQKVATTAGS